MARLRKSGSIAKHLSHCADQIRAAGGVEDDSGFFTLQPERLFVRTAALEVEIGSGKGDFIIERAQQLPERNFLAIELSGAIFQWLAARCMRSGLTNLRAVRADARSAVNLMLPAASVDAYHVYFPDPWPKNRHSKHRLFSPALVAGFARSLVPGGRLYVATDVEWYYERMLSLVGERGFRMAADGACGAARTGFGRKFVALGRPIHSACFEKVPEVGG